MTTWKELDLVSSFVFGTAQRKGSTYTFLFLKNFILFYHYPSSICLFAQSQYTCVVVSELLTLYSHGLTYILTMEGITIAVLQTQYPFRFMLPIHCFLFHPEFPSFYLGLVFCLKNSLCFFFFFFQCRYSANEESHFFNFYFFSYKGLYFTFTFEGYFCYRILQNSRLIVTFSSTLKMLFHCLLTIHLYQKVCYV